MAWLFFMDESGHDHVQMPYEVRGGFALKDANLWSFVREAMTLEMECFGVRLSDYKSEIKGHKLLARERFDQLDQDTRPPFPPFLRRSLCRGLLQAGLERRGPTKDQMTAYAQACLAMADGLFDLLEKKGAVVFASAIPKGAAKPPAGAEQGLLRKDHAFLLERFFYFLEREREMGLLVMDEVDKTADRRFVTRLHSYFTDTWKGKTRTVWIVPTPFFVASDMIIPVQVADLVIYAINWGYRFSGMTAPDRAEIGQRFGPRLNRLRWKGEGYDGIKTFVSFGIFCVPDLFTPRE
jgi:hypothetical protein